VGEVFEFGGKEVSIGYQRTDEHHDEESRADTPDSPLVESGESESAIGSLPKQYGSNQETGDGEEDIDSDKATAWWETEMIKQHGQHRYGAKSVDIGTVSKGGLQGQVVPYLSSCSLTAKSH
jgi:hypothetical protein